MIELLAEFLSVAPVAAAVLLPGYMWRQSERKFVASARISKIEEVYSYVLYSLIAYTIALLIVYKIGKLPDDFSNVTVQQGVSIFIAAAVVSYLGGIASGILRRYDAIGLAFGKVGIPTIHPVETAWDKAFSRKDGCLVRITFKDGTDRYGIYGAGSLVSAEIEDGDIFLEKTLYPSEDGLLHEHATEGMWVKSSEVQCLRFYSYTKLENQYERAAQSSAESLSQCDE